jgi:hypothetical protein
MDTGAIELISGPLVVAQNLVMDRLIGPLVFFLVILCFWQLAMAVVPKILRSNPFVFGTESILR